MRAAEYSAATTLLGDVASASSEAGEAYLEALALCYLGRLALAWGEHEEAREPLDRALGLIRRARPRARILPLVARAQLARAEGEPELARRLLEEALATARAGGEGGPRALLALAELTANESDRLEARKLYEEALELARGTDAKDYAAQALDGLARLARVEGATRQAARFQREAVQLRHACRDARRLERSVEGTAELDPASDFVVHAARLVGAADALWEDAGSGGRGGMGSPARADLGPSRAASAAGRNFAFTKGAATGAGRAVVSNGGPRGVCEMGERWESLTDREREVAELVADGLTNKAVAERLSVTPATVKTHLEHIFLKLGISRRSELAKEVWRRGGTGPVGGATGPVSKDHK